MVLHQDKLPTDFTRILLEITT